MHQHMHLKQNLELTFSQQMNLSLNILSWDIERVLSYLEEETLNNPLLEIQSPNSALVKENLYTTTSPSRFNGEKDQDSVLNYYSDELTLIDDLLMQLNTLKDLPQSLKDAARLLIELLDSNGYLWIDLKEVANSYNINEDTITKALEVVQNFEPKGVGARSIKECLLLQLNKEDKLSVKIISHYLQELADNKLEAIKTKLKVSLDQVIDAVDTIKSLNPKPGASYATNEFTKFIVPEAIIKIVDQQLMIEFYDELIPKVKVNPDYQSLHNQVDLETKKYIQEKTSDVRNIQYSIQNRKTSIRKVITYLVNFQQDYFLKGPKHLKPLTQKDLAEHFDINESTVSRAIKGKFLYTPSGLLEIKGLFSESLSLNQNTTKNTVYSYIEQIISAEDKAKPLSDNKITEKISEKGITISRRTIAKYREELGIENKQKRKIFI